MKSAARPVSSASSGSRPANADDRFTQVVYAAVMLVGAVEVFALFWLEVF